MFVDTSRNEESTTEGIDTDQNHMPLWGTLPVEMKKARLRTLTPLRFSHESLSAQW